MELAQGARLSRLALGRPAQLALGARLSRLPLGRPAQLALGARLSRLALGRPEGQPAQLSQAEARASGQRPLSPTPVNPVNCEFQLGWL